MLVIDTKRIQLFKCLIEPQGVIAEVGVAKGNFSKQISRQLNPKKLFLIDPWIYQDRPDYTMDGTNVSDVEGEKRLSAIKEYFASVDEENSISILRGFSYDEVKKIDDESLDAVYIDAMHTYEAVKEDLADFFSKVKKGGIIAGHDFTNSVFAKRKNFGVVPAVAEFVASHEVAPIAVTNELYPSYFLYKGSYNDPEYKRLVTIVQESFPIVTRLDAHHLNKVKHEVFISEDSVKKPFFVACA